MQLLKMRFTVVAIIASVAVGGVPLASAQVVEQLTVEQQNLAEQLKRDPPKSDVGRDAQNSTDEKREKADMAPSTMQGVRTPLAAADIAVSSIGTKVLPDDEAAKQAVGVVPLPGGLEREIGYVTYRWQAANICHWPIYFEEPMLERHGQQRCPTYIQPVVSGTKFLSNLLLYPYKATLQPACENRYTLGHFRPGSPAPLLHDTLPWSPRAAAVEGLAATAVAVGLPW
jgi:hypothetical protein